MLLFHDLPVWSESALSVVCGQLGGRQVQAAGKCPVLSGKGMELEVWTAPSPRGWVEEIKSTPAEAALPLPGSKTDAQTGRVLEGLAEALQHLGYL